MPVCSPFQLVTPPGIKSQPHLAGEPCSKWLVWIWHGQHQTSVPKNLQVREKDVNARIDREHLAL